MCSCCVSSFSCIVIVAIFTTLRPDVVRVARSVCTGQPSVLTSTPPAQLQASLPHAQPSATELAEMTRHANVIVTLLSDLARLSQPEAETPAARTSNSSTVSLPTPSADNAIVESRPPKRPWEDMENDKTATIEQSTSAEVSMRSLEFPYSFC